MIDGLIDRSVELENPTVVGLDPTVAMIPENLIDDKYNEHGKVPKAVAEAFVSFNEAIIDAVHDLVPAVKPQIAMYERYGLDGLGAYFRTVEYAKKKGLFVIGDIKRGDISSTAEAYAAHIDGVTIDGDHFDLWHEDAVTLNPYLGSDGIEPFIKVCEDKDRGIFILVRTSNPSSDEIQGDIYENVGDLVSQWGLSTIGRRGYSKVGAVVGATHPEEGVALRKRMPHTFFLVPGYGAQGAGAEDLRGFFDGNGLGAIINSSRGITAAWKNDGRYSAGNFADAAREAVIAMRDDLRWTK